MYDCVVEHLYYIYHPKVPIPNPIISQQMSTKPHCMVVDILFVICITMIRRIDVWLMEYNI